MHLKIQKRNGRAYLSIVQSYRQDGKAKTHTVETIGYADAFADRYEDPIEHFREYVEQLNARASASSAPIELAFEPNSAIDVAMPPARLGAAIALGCLDALGISAFFRARSGKEGFPTSSGRIFEMLATERMLHATSKRESWTARASFPRACGFSYDDVYAALPCFARERHALDKCISRRWESINGEPLARRIFLICGSYAFPVDGGSVRASIAVALGDDNMPLGYHDMSGRLDPAAFRESADVLKGRTGASRAVIVAGGLRDLGPTIDELAQTGDGFVLYQRDYAKSPELVAWTDDEAGYTPMGAGVHLKWRLSRRALSDGRELPVREVALRGGGYAVRYSHAVLVTSELDMSAAAIVQAYRELWRQAEPFQPLEADFSSVPYPTSAQDHIQAHFAICYAAFFALRALRSKMDWKHNAADTADALMRMEGTHLQRNYFLFGYRSDVTDCIETACGIPPARKLRTRRELRSIPNTVSATIHQQTIKMWD